MPVYNKPAAALEQINPNPQNDVSVSCMYSRTVSSIYLDYNMQTTERRYQSPPYVYIYIIYIV